MEINSAVVVKLPCLFMYPNRPRELLADHSTGCTDHNNEKRDDGESWVCEDGCNKCTCNKGNIVKITKMLCPGTKNKKIKDYFGN